MPKSYVSEKNKQEVRTRAHHCCEYCQSPESHATEAFSMEHIIPISRNGLNLLINLALACLGCNFFKGAKIEAIDPITKQVVSLFHPRNEIWKEHFEWSKDLTKIIGKTPTGRATVVALKLNRSGLVNLRKVFRIINIHPPSHTL